MPGFVGITLLKYKTFFLNIILLNYFSYYFKQSPLYSRYYFVIYYTNIYNTIVIYNYIIYLNCYHINSV